MSFRCPDHPKVKLGCIDTRNRNGVQWRRYRGTCGCGWTGYEVLVKKGGARLGQILKVVANRKPLLVF